MRPPGELDQNSSLFLVSALFNTACGALQIIFRECYQFVKRGSNL